LHASFYSAETVRASSTREFLSTRDHTKNIPSMIVTGIDSVAPKAMHA